MNNNSMCIKLLYKIIFPDAFRNTIDKLRARPYQSFDKECKIFEVWKVFFKANNNIARKYPPPATNSETAWRKLQSILSHNHDRIFEFMVNNFNISPVLHQHTMEGKEKGAQCLRANIVLVFIVLAIIYSFLIIIIITANNFSNR